MPEPSQMPSIDCTGRVLFPLNLNPELGRKLPTLNPQPSTLNPELGR
jgi:hypothetical protein